MSCSVPSWLIRTAPEAVTVDTKIAEAEYSSAAAGRLLTARLGYTSIQRGAGHLDQSRLEDGVLLSFAYKVLGFSTGLHEAVLLGSTETCLVPALREFAGDIGACLLKVTRAAPGPAIVGQTQTRRLRHWTVVQRSARARELLPLGPGYNDTLASFGRHTRRNIRAVRRVASESGLIFVSSTGPTLISDDDHSTLARQTRPRGVRLSLSRRFEAYVDSTGRPFRSVVRAPGGEIVSYACGYFGGPGSAYLLYQLNNPAFSALSPSLLHRAHLIEWLIESRCDEFVFVHGCTGILQHACVRQPLQELFLMRRTPAGYLAASPIAFAKADSSLGRLVRAAVLPTF